MRCTAGSRTSTVSTPLIQKLYNTMTDAGLSGKTVKNVSAVLHKALNQAVKRNENRFPDDFMFRLTAKEWAVISSQFVMTSRAKRPKSALPLAFKEHGALMLSSVLRSGSTESRLCRRLFIIVFLVFPSVKLYAVSRQFV